MHADGGRKEPALHASQKQRNGKEFVLCRKVVEENTMGFPENCYK